MSVDLKYVWHTVITAEASWLLNLIKILIWTELLIHSHEANEPHHHWPMWIKVWLTWQRPCLSSNENHEFCLIIDSKHHLLAFQQPGTGYTHTHTHTHKKAKLGACMICAHIGCFQTNSIHLICAINHFKREDGDFFNLWDKDSMFMLTTGFKGWSSFNIFQSRLCPLSPKRSNMRSHRYLIFFLFLNFLSSLTQKIWRI